MERPSPLGESDLERGGSMLQGCEHGGAGVMLYKVHVYVFDFIE